MAELSIGLLSVGQVWSAGETVELEMIGSSLESHRKREIGNNTVGVRTQQKKRRAPRIDSCRVASF